MHFESFSIGSLQIDGAVYEYDLTIDRSEIRRRRKRASNEYRTGYGDTLRSIKEDIPWHRCQLVLGTGAQGA
jgi:hypothetical protein